MMVQRVRNGLIRRPDWTIIRENDTPKEACFLWALLYKHPVIRSAMASHIGKLAKSDTPFDNPDALLAALKAERREGRYLEWKQELPYGASASRRAKFRFVRAIAAFANTDGGFVVCGVSPGGEWIGIEPSLLRLWDLADITTILGTCLVPEIADLSITVLEDGGRRFPVLHVASSPQMPHVTIKEEFDLHGEGKREVFLARHAVYCRYVARCEPADPTHFERIIKRRTDWLKSEVMRRVKEVEVPLFTARSARRAAAAGTPAEVRVTDNPDAPEVRLTRGTPGSGTALVHERLSEGLFNDVNNVLKAAAQMSGDRDALTLTPEVYYRVYRDRHAVQLDPTLAGQLACAALSQYAPCAEWLLALGQEEVARILRHSLTTLGEPAIRGTLRLLVLAGPEGVAWMRAWLQERFGPVPQPPNYHFTFNKVQAAWPDARLLNEASQTSAGSTFVFPDGKNLKLEDLLSSEELAQDALTEACACVHLGHKDYKSYCRQLDIIAYADRLRQHMRAVVPLLSEAASS